MNLNQNTLVAFEKERSDNGYIPPYKSDSFYTIGSGIIDLYTLSADLINYRFDIMIKAGTIYVGDGYFCVCQDNHYNSIKVSKNTGLINNGQLSVKSSLDVYGSFTLQANSSLTVNGSVTLEPSSALTIEKDSAINITGSGSMKIYGTINIDVTLVDKLLNTPGIYVDSAAVLIVKNINLGDREESLTDYEYSLRSKSINKYTQGEHDLANGKVGYVWKGGNPNSNSQIIEINTLYGNIVLGDFKLSALGTQTRIQPNLQITQDVHIKSDSTLYIAEKYNGYTYLHPELYIGIVIDNCNRPGKCTVDGTIIVDGENAKINIDRLGTLTIDEGGYIYLKNKSIIESTNNDDTPVLFIDGTLVIDDISQLSTFNSSNIQFGDNGKVIINNLNNGTHTVLFSTPDGIKDSELYRIFRENITHIEYHIPKDSGIRIDHYYDYYPTQMTDWYGGMRIEKAIKDKLIVWESGAFIELDHSIIPWADITDSLLEASRIFKTSTSFDDDRLQEAINHLIYAGCGNIVFRYINGDEYKDITLVLDKINVQSVTNAIDSDDYILNTDAEGELFLKHNISDTSSNNIIDNNATMVHIQKGATQFSLQ